MVDPYGSAGRKESTLVYRWLDIDTLVAEQSASGVTKRIYLTGKKRDGVVVSADKRQDNILCSFEVPTQSFYLRLALAGRRFLADAFAAIDPRGHSY